MISMKDNYDKNNNIGDKNNNNGDIDLLWLIRLSKGGSFQTLLELHPVR